MFSQRWHADGEAPAFGSVPAAVVLLYDDELCQEAGPAPQTQQDTPPNTLRHAHHPPRIEVHVTRWRRRLGDEFTGASWISWTFD